MQSYKLSVKGALAVNSSGGQLLKWRVGNKYIKTSTLVTTTLKPSFMYESYAEVIASHLCKLLGFDHVSYSLCHVSLDNGLDTIACQSTNFLSETELYVSVAKLMLEGKIPMLSLGDSKLYDTLIHSVSKLCPTFWEYVDTLLVLDYIILNDDRHLGNLGIVVGKRGQGKCAPIFDCGNSLFFHKHTEGINYRPELNRYLIAKPFAKDFEQQLALVQTNISLPRNIDTEMHTFIVNLVTKYELPRERGEFAYEVIRRSLNKLVDRYGYCD